MTSHGQKVTTDPESKRAVGEAGGLVTSDSLAAESIREGGSFGANNERIDVSKQPSYSTTTNTTDTSNARRLDPAVDAEAREAQSSWNEQAEQAELDIQPRDKTQGIGPTYNTPSKSGGGYSSTSGGRDTSSGGRDTSSGGRDDYSGGRDTTSGGYGNTSDDRDTTSGGRNTGSGGYSSTSGDSGAGGSRPDVDAAPTYVDVNQHPNYYRDGEESKPRGKNLTEGGFDSDAPNASFNTTDIGGKNDPGRDAMRKTERSAADSGYPEDTGSSGKGQYGDLREERA